MWRNQCCLQALVYFHRVRNPPVPKELKVQLLESASTAKKESVGRDSRAAHREVGSAATTAAATAAAAIATTAPQLKVSSLW